MNSPVIAQTQLVGQRDAQTEWWYYSGHLKSGPRNFGFQLTFFGRKVQDELILGIVPLRWLSPKFRFAHFAISDFDRQQFHFSHRRSIRLNAGAAFNHFEAWHGNWRVEEREGAHCLRALMRGIEMDLELQPRKSQIQHGEDGKVYRNDHQSGIHISIPRFGASGRLKLDGESFEVTGEAWMDREFGHCDFDRQMGGWDWLYVQLDDGRELMLYCVCDEKRDYNEHRTIVLVNADGTKAELKGDRFRLTALGQWTSPWTGTTYPSGWSLQVPEWKIDVKIIPRLECQELETRGSTSIIYWEGGAAVTGEIDHRAVTGKAFVELVGYNGEHRILVTKKIGPKALWRAFQNEGQYWLRHWRVTRTANSCT
ncbi:MAG: lipocalin-like domain-containing protein [Pirellulaceae bacterium]